MPKSAIANDRNRALVAAAVKGAVGGRPKAIAHGRTADFKRRQAGEEMTADVGGDLVLAQLFLHQLHRGKDRAFGAAGAEPRWADRHSFGKIRDGRAVHIRRAHSGGQHGGGCGADKAFHRIQHDHARIFPGHREEPLAVQLHAGACAVEIAAQLGFNELRLALFHHQNMLFAFAELQELRGDQGICHVQHIKRDVRVAVDIGKPQTLKGADHAIVHAALHDNAEIGVAGAEKLVQATFDNELFRRWPAVFHLVLLMRVRHRRQHDAGEIAARVGQRVPDRQLRALVVTRGEGPCHMARPDPQHEHNRGTRGLRQIKPVRHHLDDRRQVRPRIQKPHLRLHGEGVAAFLHDGRAFAVILAHNHHSPAGHAR